MLRFLNYPVSECRHLGILRIEVPAYVAKLRWSDYVERNRLTRRRRAYFTSKGNPANWLATDQRVPFNLVRGLAVWHRDAWIDASEIDANDYDRCLAELNACR